MPHAWGEKDCHQEKLLFKHKCDLSIRRGVGYIPPHHDCCRTVPKIDMNCVCHTMTEEDEETIDVHHIYFVSQDCHKPVPIGDKCGSKFLILSSFFIMLVHL
ncbi:hypothetical protein BAE44_0011261 [Dichanthelium oligosanthes]|uniref:Bifunctional inhibitor/plant lipid transfer protein/seed storage helical domain-containing protein n=1 Tax=Dichanthelium oligosanthes TaxID=888268 RepID=A0A1E5VRG9_9POAL|nr:hypothetical protein BAE44_0011261 [Dichanthelium oligosanthes]